MDLKSYLFFLIVCQQFVCALPGMRSFRRTSRTKGHNPYENIFQTIILLNLSQSKESCKASKKYFNLSKLPGAQIKFCGWAYKVDHNIWNFVPNLKIGEKRRSLIEVQITT